MTYAHKPDRRCPACGAPWTPTGSPHPGSLECRHAAGCAAVEKADR